MRTITSLMACSLLVAGGLRGTRCDAHNLSQLRTISGYSAGGYEANSGGASPDDDAGPLLARWTVRCLSVDESLHGLGVAGALHRDGGRRGLDLVQVSGGELEVGGGEVLVESGELAGAGDRDDPWLMRAIADVEPWYLRAYSASTAGATSGCPAALTSIQVTSRATPGAWIRPWCHQDLDRRAVVHRLVPGGNLVTVFSSSPPIRGSSPPTLQVTRSRPLWQ